MSSLPSYASAPSAPLSRSSSSTGSCVSSSSPLYPSPLSAHDSRSPSPLSAYHTQATISTNPARNTTAAATRNDLASDEADPFFGFEIPDGMLDRRVERVEQGRVAALREYRRDMVRYYRERVRVLKRRWVVEHRRAWGGGVGGDGDEEIDGEMDIDGRRGMECSRRDSDAPFYGRNIGRVVEADFDGWVDDSEIEDGTSSEGSAQQEYDARKGTVDARTESQEAVGEDERREQSDDEQNEDDSSSSPTRTHLMNIVTKHLALSTISYRPTRPMVYQTFTDISDSGTEDGAAESSKRVEPLISSIQGSGLECFPRFEEMRAMVGDEESWWTKSRGWVCRCCSRLMGC